MLGSVIFYGKQRDYSYDEISKKLTIRLVNNNEIEILKIASGIDEINISHLIGFDGIYSYIYYFNNIKTNKNISNDLTGKITLHTEIIFEFSVASIFKSELNKSESANNILLIKDEVINYLFSPMRKIKIHVNGSENPFDWLRTYEELPESEYSKKYIIDANLKFNFKLGIDSSKTTKSDKTHMENYNSYITLTFKNESMTIEKILYCVQSLINMFNFIFRTKIDGFSFIEYYGKFERDGRIDDIKGNLNLFTSSNIDNLANVVGFDKLDKSMENIITYFFNKNQSPYYYDKVTNIYNPLKIYVMLSNFDTLTEKMKLKNERLTELRKIGNILASYIEDDEEIKKYKEINIERMKGLVLGIRNSYRDKMNMIIESYPPIKEDTYLIYSRKMTDFRNEIMHGNINKTNITFEDLRKFERLIYVVMFRLMNLENEEIKNCLSSIFLLH
ncbi:MAG: hypothetical protein RBR50_00810 [Candidatus Izemoplasmatales bacterium]|nr:hypothetical protein [Candidatus Izemoplasmatales bacterium]